MSEYLVLARKYRSTTFDEVVGQEPISTTLSNAIRTGRIAHAFLFTGTRGVGKTSMARILAKALNCLSSDGPTPTPCGTCDACVAIARGDDMDVIEIDGASNRGIDEIRDLRNNAALRPARARYKIYYIDEVHMLTKEAFNALLKTLEEPPGHVKFIFATTEAEKVPATILSRCQRFDFRNIPTHDIAAHLAEICRAEKIPIREAAIFRVARAAAGSMRDGVSLLDQLISSASGELTEPDVLRVLGTPPDERIAALMACVAASDPAGALEQVDAILAGGYPLEGVVAALAEQFRNVMLALTCGPDSRLIELPETQRAALAELAKQFTVPAAVHAVGVCEQLGRSVRGSSSARALTEAAVVRLAAADKFVDVTSLVDRLERIGGGGAARPAAPARPGSAMPPGAAQKKKLTAPAASAPAAERAATGASRFYGQGSAPAAAPAGRAPAAPAAPAAASHPSPSFETPAITWTTEGLAAQWRSLVRRLGAMPGGGPPAGAIQPARVSVREVGVLELAYDTEMEPMRQRAQALADRIEAALSELTGVPVRCRFLASGRSAGTGRAVVNGVMVGGISSGERQKVANDPAVKALLEMFGGQVSDLCPDVERLAEEPAAGEETAVQEPAPASLDEPHGAEEDEEWGGGLDG